MNRLEVNDRVDPYIAVYSPPTPSRTGTITHLRWRGLLSPVFVQSIIDAALYVFPPLFISCWSLIHDIEAPH